MWKVIGALVGLFAGNFLWAVAGFIVGAAADEYTKKGKSGFTFSRAGIREQQQAYFRTLFILMGRLAKADGQVSQEEIQLAQAVMQQLRLSPEAQKEAQRLFNEGKDANFDLNSLLTHFRQAVSSDLLIQSLVDTLLVSAYADGHFSLQEKALVSQICAHLGISVSQFDAIHERVKQQFHFRQGYQNAQGAETSADLLDSAYQLLGVTKSMSDSEIKKAYRRLMSQNHPDKLSSKGLPDEMIEHAKQKTQEIQSAYEMIKKSRK
ncbi:co-chaperone DjlA [Marinomonas mediterranea]|jgi:DnaJ-domain-containing proteins 1|uniref:Heat shock protein DnaJ domain protein n=1 Tax=Marinomonas mediterranea (strain ATCC 700492 / JCM 21426 / NBRC 103028 / MMB-1) TaxID=717774 RepID=F2K4J8_MARM1|nr:co-chaperone DjlA [Marinomonas mediterranea]ADZ90297.1 heat shock protein DnaJ domain protein [Marinomonas mediterranea MMB-1]WCN08357.1 co-chaperone DjlA [Marinomonas mediterranea]WCN16487.1 co-chaperone DjlA [Marinomonas mediterranea MMB-1]